MGKKVFWNKKSKLLTLSTVLTSSLSLLAIPNNITNNYSFVNSITNNINSKATNFDYIPVANNVNSQPVSTSVGFLGINSNNNKLYLTSYEGVTVWEFDAVNNSMVKQYYQNMLGINDISGYSLKSWKYIESKDIIAMLLSDANKNNSTVFGINASTGLLYTTNLDENGDPIPESNMVQVNSGLDVLWLNSADQIIASKFSNLNDFFWNTFTISFEDDGVSSFRTPIRQQTVINIDDAKKVVQQKLSGNDTVNGNTFYHEDIGWMDSEGQTGDKDVSIYNWEMHALIEGERGSNTNIGIFTNKNRFSHIRPASGAAQRDAYLQQAVLLDDDLNAIRDENGNSIVLTLNNPVAYDDVGSIGVWQKSSDLQKYGYKGTKVGTIQNFIWLTSGVYNAVTQFAYDSSNKTISMVSQYDMQRQTDQDVIAYSYDVNENRFFTTNSYTDSNTAIGYIDFDDATVAYKSLVTSTLTAPGMVPNTLNFSPVVSKQSIIETPIVYYDSTDNTKIKGLYFPNGSNQATIIDLTRKSYEDILTKIQTFGWYKSKATSDVTDDDLLASLTFDSQPLNGSFTSKVVSKTANDNNGTLNFKFETSYQNWWNNTTTSSFNIERTITGMYAKNNSSFSFVTTNTGNDENDEMLKKQITFKENNYPTAVTFNDVSTYFALAKIKDVDNNLINLTEDMVTLNADNVNGTLSIKIDYSSKLPSGLSNDYLVYQQTFDGFKNLKDFSIKPLSEQEQENSSLVSNFKQENYASLIQQKDNYKKEFLSNFFDISGYSNDINDWDFIFTKVDDFTGTLQGKLSYKNSADFPENYKEISFSFTGFKNIPNQLKNVTVSKYNGYKKSDDVWNEYVNAIEDNVNQTALASLINVPYIDFKDLQITKNSSTRTELDLTINIKPNITTSLKIGDNNLVLNDDSLNKLANSGISYPFKVKVPIESINQSFIFNAVDGQQIDLTSEENDYIVIDLNKDDYKIFDKSKTADQITVDEVRQLYSVSGFTEQVDLQPDVQQGILYVTVSLNALNVSDNTKQTKDIASGNGIVKTFEIKGFEKPSSNLILALSLTGAAAAIVIAISIAIYVGVIRRNLKKFLANNEDPNTKYLKSNNPKAKQKNVKKVKKVSIK